MPPTNTPPADSQQNVPATPAVPAPPVVHEGLHIPHKPVDVVATVATPPPAPVATPPAPTPVPDAAELVFADMIPAADLVTHVSVEGDVPMSATADTATVSAPIPDPVATVSIAPEILPSPDPLPVVPEIVELSIDEQIAKEEEHLKVLAARRERIHVESEKLFQSRKDYEDQVAPLLLDEKLIIERVDALEKKKHLATTATEQRAIEEERWVEEEKRRAIEDAKWPISEKLEGIVTQVKEGEGAFRELLAEEAEGNARITKLRIEAKQLALQRDLEEVTARREATEAELEQYRITRESLEAELHDTKEYDETALQAEHVVDAKADTARTLYEERVLAEERHKLELERRAAEKRRWEAEDAIPGVDRSVQESQTTLESIKKEEAEVLAKLSALGS